jgi:hypothetical protein
MAVYREWWFKIEIVKPVKQVPSCKAEEHLKAKPIFADLLLHCRRKENGNGKRETRSFPGRMAHLHLGKQRGI